MTNFNKANTARIKYPIVSLIIIFQPTPMTLSNNPSQVRETIGQLYDGYIKNHSALPEIIRQNEYMHVIQVIGAMSFQTAFADNNKEGMDLRIYTGLRILQDMMKVCLQAIVKL